jgi:hypothetical protein
MLGIHILKYLETKAKTLKKMCRVSASKLSNYKSTEIFYKSILVIEKVQKLNLHKTFRMEKILRKNPKKHFLSH